MKLYIGNLSWGTTTEDLKSHFEQFGAVSDAIVITDRQSGRSRGFGFVTMDNDEEASKMGRVDVVLKDKDTATVCWIEPSDESASLMLADVHLDGTVTNRRTVAEVSPSRSSGFPRLAKVQGGILVAWTDVDRDKGISTKFFSN